MSNDKNHQGKGNSSRVKSLLSFVLLIGAWLCSLTDFSGEILIPAGVALGVILLTRSAIFGLFCGAVTGCFFLTDGHLGASLKSLVSDHFFASMQGTWKISAILFTLILGAFTVVIERGGGFEAILRRLLESKKGNAKRRLESATGFMGLICFFDGLANSMLLGRVTRPLADRAEVPRARMAYFVDSTSSSVACLAFISTWIATQLSLIQQGIEGSSVKESAYELFFQSISQNFYCLFTLILVAIVIWRQWNIGPMRNAQVTSKKEEAQESVSYHQAKEQTKAITALAPLAILTSSIILLFYLWDTSPLLPITREKIVTAFGGNAGPYALTIGSVIGLLAAWFFFPKTKRHQAPAAMRDGAASMLSPLMILLMAWTFGSVTKELGAARWLADSIGSKFSADFFPAAIFLTGACISFVTGSSWGTMGLLMPLAVPGYLEIAGDQPEMLPAVIGAVFSGAVFGDHCSPFSDTTIVSAFACGVTPHEHVITQLPYALLSAGTALLIGYVGLGLGMPPSVSIVLGASVLGMLGYLCTHRKKESSHE